MGGVGGVGLGWGYMRWRYRWLECGRGYMGLRWGYKGSGGAIWGYDGGRGLRWGYMWLGWWRRFDVGLYVVRVGKDG